MAKSNSTQTAAHARAPDGAASETLQCEILVVGGGLVGLSLAIALADIGVSVVVVDRADPQTTVAPSFDGRASAIARGSQQMLAAIGIWDRLASDAEAIRDIRVSDGRVSQPPGARHRGAPRGVAAHLYLHYDSRDNDGAPLGYIVENRLMRLAVLARLRDLPTLRLLAPARLAAVDRSTAGVSARLSDGRRIEARLAVAADGRGSALRASAGIGTDSWNYDQDGIVCAVGHDEPHHGVAHEHFLPSGPFALLPMTDAEDGTHRSSLVWTEERALTGAVLALDDASFNAEMERRFGDSLGRLRVLGRRWSYPLALLHAKRYFDRRLVLIGDAAHGIHPIAGQGLNLGLRDVAALAEVLVDARRLGLDLGDPGVLQRYQRWRRFDNMALIAATDSLNRLFSNDNPGIRLARDLGMAAVDRVPPLKRFFMHHAMGLVGDLPRLIRGEAL